jgi:hypothetical protein
VLQQPARRARNLIQQASNEVGLAAHPSNCLMMNADWLQIAMLAYNLTAWLELFRHEENVSVAGMKHT